ncbi:phospholipase D family protein [Variovorax ginsengisoli]|uniref:Cardiolipin synthase n=1 Tax=Variovorax ginsengisoli TaxID=363844 RepID=A0ABT9SDY5_9BURK|nr:phospholipase D family protein [Variovorax ginsengisoli]MDP9902104.1 putative cardiolipin synthase [Variovorax ginsengisoli]
MTPILFRRLAACCVRSRWTRMGAGLWLSLWLAACGSLPAFKQMPETLSPPVDPTTALARVVAASTPPGESSGFRLMPLGVYSLDARIELARRAQRTLDVQYYVIANDGAGRLLLRALKEAALRGVRVRLLVDDLYTATTDRLLRALAATPNIEVRLFNPFCCARENIAGRFIASAFDIRRLNHRMHNKLFIADGVMAVAGGRNIADEYFTLNTAQNFIDMDALVVGQVLGPLGAIFDDYWNSEEVYPIAAIVEPHGGRPFMAAEFDEWVGMAGPPPRVVLPPTDVLGYGPIGEELDAGRIGLLWGDASAVADPPAKLRSLTPEQALATSVTMRFWTQLLMAQHEVVLTSPYLVPGDNGMKAFEDLRRRQVEVTLLTNSLAANDEPLVHSGYARYRERLLKAGIDVYELSPARTTRSQRLGVFGSSLGRLHAKTAVVDRKTMFIGSVNLDPRSATQNTELGIAVHSPQLAREMLRIINISKLESAYRVRLSESGGRLEWLSMDDDKEIILYTEPESTWLQRLKINLLGPLVPEELL